MQRFELTTKVDKPIDQVWRFLTEPQYAGKWMKNVHGLVKYGKEPLSKGTKLKLCRQFLGQRMWLNLEVTEYVPQELYELSCHEGDVHCRYTYRLTTNYEEPSAEEVSEEAASIDAPESAEASSEAEEGADPEPQPVQVGPVEIELMVEYQIRGFASLFAGIFDRFIEEYENDHLDMFQRTLDPPKVDYTPKVVHTSEIFNASPKIDPDATLSEIAAQRDGSIPVEEPPRTPRTVDEAQDDLARTLDNLAKEDASRNAP